MPRGIGDNSGVDVMNQTAQSQLASIVERVERLNEDRAAVMDDIKEVFSEAKGNGFDTAAIRRLIRRRAQDAAKLAEQEAIDDLYHSALGLV